MNTNSPIYKLQLPWKQLSKKLTKVQLTENTIAQKSKLD